MKTLNLCAVCLMASLTLSCAATPANNPCPPWLQKFSPDKGFEQRWTRGEKEQGVTLNRNVEQFCR